MNEVPPLLIALVAAIGLALSLGITPLVRKVAVDRNFIDRPDRERKLHDNAVALGGGFGIWLALWGTVALILTISTSFRELLISQSDRITGLFVASGLIVLVGLVDDRVGIRGRHKLFGQIAAAAILIYFGFKIEGVRIFGVQMTFGALSIPITLGWLLLATNALNLIDGIDGLATTVGLIFCATLACLAFLNGHLFEAVVLAAMGGAVAGFLRYNFPPASIFLGDAGSMLIGLWVGVISIPAALKGPAIVGLAAPLAVWTIPVIDTLAAIVRRKLTGRSIYATDRGHLHHCLQQIAGSSRRTLYLIVLACSATCIGALASVATKSDLCALISEAAVVGVLIATRSFGFGELQLISGKLHGIVQPLIPSFGRSAVAGKQQIVRLQGSRPWELIWKSLLDLSEEYNLVMLSLDINIPLCHENYHVSWSIPPAAKPIPQWKVLFPLCVGEKELGQIVVAGLHDGHSACRHIAVVLEVLQVCENRFRDEVVNSIKLSQERREFGGSDSDLPNRSPGLSRETEVLSGST